MGKVKKFQKPRFNGSELRLRQTMKARGQDVFESRRFSDCKFYFTEIGEPGEPTKIISANRSLLALSSPVFETMFFGSLPESNNIVIEDIDFNTFKTLLSYIYTRDEDVTLESVPNAFKLLYAARKYDVSDIEDICESYLSGIVEPSNACLVFEFGKLFEKPKLCEVCLTLIQAKTIEVLASTTFLNADLSTVITIFEQDKLFINSELDLFEALNRYAIKNNLLPKMEEDSPKTATLPKETDGTCDNSSPASSELHSTINDALKKIRFLTLSGAQFETGPMRSELLSQQEKLFIVSNILASDSAFYTMPDGFTRDTLDRGLCQTILSKLENVLKHYPNDIFNCSHTGNIMQKRMDYILFSCTDFSGGRKEMINCFKEDGVNQTLHDVLEKNKSSSLVALCRYIHFHKLHIKYLQKY